MNRRDFLKASVLAGLAAPVGNLHANDEATTEDQPHPIPRREYKEGGELSVIGFGGIVVSGAQQKVADRTVAEAIERSVNYFDVAPTYGDAELKLGPALKGRRDGVFLACKTTQRGAEGARKELERSLTRLQTDHFDLYQFHAVSTEDDVKKILAPGGAAETFWKAREEGKVRYLGLSAHAEGPAIDLMEQFRCDSVLFPLNYTCWAQGDFGPRLTAYAKEKGVTILALKALARSRLAPGQKAPYSQVWYQPVQDRELARKAMAFALGEGAVSLLPPGAPELFQMALELAPDLPELTAEQREELLNSTEGLTPLFSSK